MNSALTDVIKERLKNAFLINFIICWSVVNHNKILYLLLSDDKPSVKLDYINNLKFDFSSDILFPAMLVIAYIYIIPLINLALMWVKLKFIEPLLTDFQKSEKNLRIDGELAVEDKRLDLIFREKEREADLDEKRTINQTTRTKAAELEAKYSDEKRDSEAKALAHEKERLAELEKIMSIEEVNERQRILDDREALLINEKRRLENEAIKYASLNNGATFINVDRNVMSGDKVNINFSGSIEGVDFEGGYAENFEIKVGSNRMTPGFESQLIGRSAGEEFDIDVTFPIDYHAENLKGKLAKFKIKINSVSALMVPAYISMERSSYTY